jgi:phage head maturation protease
VSEGLRRTSTGTVAIRAADDGDGRNLDGYAYRWGTTTEATLEFGGVPESFERGAFLPAIAARGDRPTPFLDRHGGNVIGGVRFTEDDIGLRYHGRLLDTQAARDYAATVPVNDGVSLEWIYRNVKSKRAGNGIVHQQVPRIAALAGEYVPAFDGAYVALRGGTNMTEQETAAPVASPPTPVASPPTPVAAAEPQAGIVPLTREQISRLATDSATEVMRQYAERGALTAGATDPLAGYGTLGELVHAAAKRDAQPELRAHAAKAIARRALDDTTFNSGANAGLASGNLVTQDLQRLVNRGRPAISAFGGPRPLGDIAGLTLNWPYFDGTLSDFVAAQSAEKAAIVSASVDIKLGTEPLLTYAGGSDISYQVLRRGTPSILDMYARIWLAAWAAVTDAAFVTELESGSVTVDLAEAISAVDLAELTGHFITASLAVEAATGQPAQFVLASTTAFTKAANLIAPSNTDIAAASSMDLRGLRIAVGNLPVIHVAGITAGKMIASNELAAAWYEDGPFLASDDDVEKLGRNVAYWSLGGGARFIPAGIVEIYDVTP